MAVLRGMLLLLWLACFGIGPATAASSQADPALARLSLSQLQADPPPEQVLAGGHDAGFIAKQGHNVLNREGAAQWWRIVADRELPAAAEPVLRVGGIVFAHVEVALPGEPLQRLAVYGPTHDPRHVGNYVALRLPQGLQQGQAIYLRLDGRHALGLRVSINSRDQLLRADLSHARWRGATLTLIGLVGLLALLFAIGLNHPSFAWLGLMVLSNLVYAMAVGGEARELPWLGTGAELPRRLSWVAAIVSVMAASQFLRGYLDLRRSLPWADRVFRVLVSCMLLVLPLMLFDSPFQSALMTLSNALAALVAVSAFVATVMLALRRHPGSGFAVLAMLPVIIATGLIALEFNGLWQGGGWSLFFNTAAMALAGLVLLAGMSSRLLLLRRERDSATHSAMQDELTGGLNRRGVEQALETAMASTPGGALPPLSVAFVDIDNFKQINDSHGHAAGDICLRHVAHVLRGQLDERGLIGRWGGDELLVLLPGLSLQQATARAERMSQALREHPLKLAGQRVGITVSMGVAQRQPDDSTRQLLARADAALLQAKREGRDRVRSG